MRLQSTVSIATTNSSAKLCFVLWLATAVTAPLPDAWSQNLSTPVGRIKIDAATKLRDFESVVTSIDMSPDGRFVVAGAEGAFRIYDAGSMRTIAGPFQISGTVNDATFSADSSLLAVLGNAKVMKFYSTRTWKPIASATESWWYWRVEFHPSRHECMTVGGNPVIRRWDAQTGKKIAEYETPFKSVSALSIHPDGHSFAIAGLTEKREHVLQVCDYDSFAVKKTLAIGPVAIDRILHSNDGSTIVTSTKSGLIQR